MHDITNTVLIFSNKTCSFFQYRFICNLFKAPLLIYHLLYSIEYPKSSKRSFLIHNDIFAVCTTRKQKQYIGNIARKIYFLRIFREYIIYSKKENRLSHAFFKPFKSRFSYLYLPETVMLFLQSGNYRHLHNVLQNFSMKNPVPCRDQQSYSNFSYFQNKSFWNS